MDEGDNSLPLAPRERAILAALEAGCTKEAAAGAANISRVTLWRMIQADETFRNAVQKAEDFAESRAVHYVVDAMPKEWQAAAWWLERRRPAQYGRRMIVDMSIRDEAQRLAAKYGLDPDALMRDAEELLKSGGE